MGMNYKHIQEQAKYILLLAKKIEEASINLDKEGEYSGGRNSGTIRNLAPELSKAASKIKQMKGEWFQINTQGERVDD